VDALVHAPNLQAIDLGQQVRFKTPGKAKTEDVVGEVTLVEDLLLGWRASTRRQFDHSIPGFE